MALSVCGECIHHRAARPRNMTVLPAVTGAAMNRFNPDTVTAVPAALRGSSAILRTGLSLPYSVVQTYKKPEETP